jgi:peptidoglycan/LPS O-acetylase OafA/YrhL
MFRIRAADEPRMASHSDYPPDHRYFPALDGLRTVSVCIVLAFHHGLFPAGWVGVDIFFVLSGFLITGILRNSAHKPSYLRTFYIKRTTRIVPPVIILLVSVFLIVRTFSWAYIAYLLFAGNIVELTRASIWLLSPLWSLAIEEHFYLAWPFAVRRLSGMSLIRVGFAVLLAEPLLRCLCTIALRHTSTPQLHWNTPSFLLTPFRLDGLVAGALLSLLLERASREGATQASIFHRLRHQLLAISLSLFALFLATEALVPSFRRTTDNLAFNSIAYTLTAIASALLIAHLVLNPGSIFTSLLAARPMVLVGRISYGVYLFQLPVKACVLRLLPHSSDFLRFFIDVPITLIVAAISFLLCESPMIRLGRRLIASESRQLLRVASPAEV